MGAADTVSDVIKEIGSHYVAAPKSPLQNTSKVWSAAGAKTVNVPDGAQVALFIYDTTAAQVAWARSGTAAIIAADSDAATSIMFPGRNGGGLEDVSALQGQTFSVYSDAALVMSILFF